MLMSADVKTSCETRYTKILQNTENGFLMILICLQFETNHEVGNHYGPGLNHQVTTR